MSADDITQAVGDWLAAFGHALAGSDADGVAALFCDDECYWRDFVAFTWNIATLDGRMAIADMVAAQAHMVLPFSAQLAGEASSTGDTIEGWFDFETRAARGKGHVRLRDGRAVTLMTAILALKGHEEAQGHRRVEGMEPRARRNRVSWTDARAAEVRALGTEVQPYCLIVGGGQGGLALGARLKRLGVPTLIIDALAKPGDAWRSRYKSLCLHDPVWLDHLPYLPFPDHWPVYTPKDKMGDFLEAYAQIMELDFWGATVCRKAAYDAGSGAWTVEVERNGACTTLRPAQLVLATGLSGKPQIPAIPGADSFAGEQYHSAQHVDASAFAGKACVVVGANNSAHDICVDLWSAGADVTMIQRSPTTVVTLSALRRIAEEGPFSEKARDCGIDTERADLMVGSVPFRMRERIDRANSERMQREDADFYDRLAASGFLFDFGADNTATAGKYSRRASGYYIDVGCSGLIIDGEVKVRSRVGISRICPHSVVLSDGSELPADLIVYATGYGPMESWAEMLISKDVADRIGRCWGLGSNTPLDPGPWEGELRNMWKPTAQDGLWFHGGNLAQSRFHSLHLALQIKARMERIPTPVFQPLPVERPPLGTG
jgi:putative flavoprotein involved in K+ transport